MNEKISFQEISDAYSTRLKEHRERVKNVEAKIELKEKQLQRLHKKVKAFNAVYPR